MEKAFVRLTALVTDDPDHRPAALAEARMLLAQIGSVTNNPSGAAIATLAAAVARDVEAWFGPYQWRGQAPAIAAAKADLLADLLRLHAALLRRHH